MNNFLCTLLGKRHQAVTGFIHKPHAFPTHGNKPPVIIRIDPAGLIATRQYARQASANEVGGVLIGSWPQKEIDGHYLVNISDAILARHTRMNGTSLTFMADSWRYMNDELLRRYPLQNATIVGWFHTYPGLGIFFSDMDSLLLQTSIPNCRICSASG